VRFGIVADCGVVVAGEGLFANNQAGGCAWILGISERTK
jgi:hypothetical protein